MELSPLNINSLGAGAHESFREIFQLTDRRLIKQGTCKLRGLTFSNTGTSNGMDRTEPVEILLDVYTRESFNCIPYEF